MNISNVTTNFNATTSEEWRQGWTPSPDGRGTIDVIWSCFLTLFLCCWSTLVVNVPSPGSNFWQIVGRKFYLVGLCLLAPEIIFQCALGQWMSARQSVQLFHESGFTDWTIRHGFYANMGGVHFQPPDWKSFPVDAKQLHYLITKGYVEYPHLSDNHIRDKNKVDGMLRFITLVQSLWFVITIIARAIQQLPITALELSTAAFVFLGIATSLCWMSKPADVSYPDIIRSRESVANILIQGGDTVPGSYHNTPLDFASREEWAWSKLWNHGLQLLRKYHLAGPPRQRPIPRFENTITPPIEGWSYGVFVVATIAYFSIFLAGWNFSFPTPVERVLWQAASLTALISTLSVCAAIQWYYSWCPALKQLVTRSRRAISAHDNNAETEPKPSPDISSQQQQQPPIEKHFSTTSSSTNQTTPTPTLTSDSNDITTTTTVTNDPSPSSSSPSPSSWLSTLRATLSNNSIMKDPHLVNPPGLVLITWFVGIFYCCSRAYIVVADFTELRSLPADAYRSVEWSGFLPHF